MCSSPYQHSAAASRYPLSLHDALPTLLEPERLHSDDDARREDRERQQEVRHHEQDRKSTRLNSSHRCISYAVFCLKKKKAKIIDGRKEVAPGLIIHPAFRGHTYGSQLL